MNAELAEYISRSKRIVFFGGAGVSTESGIPDFRSTDGLYNQQFDYPPEEILSHHFFEDDPAEFFRFYRKKMVYPSARPNAAHKALARLEEEGKLKTIVTQNIDGLHQQAGSRQVCELHGSIHRNHCTECGRFFPLEYVMDEKSPIPYCECGGIVKPDVVLYEEGLDSEVLDSAVSAIMSADLLIIGGTSLNVYPAAGLIQYFAGDSVIIINTSPTPADKYASLVIAEPIGRALG